MAAPRVLFVCLTDDIGSDRLVSDLGRAGAACAVIGPRGSFASLSRCVEATFPMPRRWPGVTAPLVLARRVGRAVSRWHPDRIVPLDDLSATLLRTLSRKVSPTSSLGALLRISLGAPDGYAAACERVALMEAAVEAGVRTPPFTVFSGFFGSRRVGMLPLPVMVKRDQSSGSGGVSRVDRPERLASAIRIAWLKSAAKARLARDGGLGRAATPVLVQGVVEGRLAMYTAVCREGQVIDGAGFLAVESHPVKRSSTILRHCPHAEMADAARRLVARLRCSGFVSLDFILDASDRAFLIELNPRPIGSVHLGRLFGHDLARAFLTGRAAPPGATCTPAGDIALFPKELERDPAGQRLRAPGVDHDVPSQEPAVVAAYLARLTAEHPAHASDLAAACGVSPATPPITFPTGVRPEPC